MPYRRLPNTDQARLRALRTVIQATSNHMSSIQSQIGPQGIDNTGNKLVDALAKQGAGEICLGV